MDNRVKIEIGRDSLEQWLTGPMRALDRRAMAPEALAYLSSAEQLVSRAIGQLDTALRHGTDEAIEAAFILHRDPLPRADGAATLIIDNATGALVE